MQIARLGKALLRYSGALAQETEVVCKLATHLLRRHGLLSTRVTHEGNCRRLLTTCLQTSVCKANAIVRSPNPFAHLAVPGIVPRPDIGLIYGTSYSFSLSVALTSPATLKEAPARDSPLPRAEAPRGPRSTPRQRAAALARAAPCATVRACPTACKHLPPRSPHADVVPGWSHGASRSRASVRRPTAIRPTGAGPWRGSGIRAHGRAVRACAGRAWRQPHRPHIHRRSLWRLPVRRALADRALPTCLPPSAATTGCGCATRG